MKIRRLQRWISEQLFGHSLKLAVGTALVFNAGATDASAQTWAPTASANWNDTASWSGGIIPVSGNTTALVFGGSTPYTATNDLGAFTLNSITVNNTDATTIDGGAGLTFDGTTPAITINAGSGATTISGPMTYSVATGIANNSSSLLTLSGTQAINGNLTFSGTGANTITGATTIAAARTITNNGTGLLTLGAVNPATFTLTVAGTGNTTIGGIIGGTATTAITKTGGGTLTLSGVNTYTGVTQINGGRVVVTGATSLGANSADVTINGGTLQLNASMGTVSNAATARIVTVGSGGATFDFGVNQTFSGNGFTGTGNVTKTGIGVWSVGSNASTYSGQITLSNGVLRLTSPQLNSVSGFIVNSGATYEVNDDVTDTFSTATGGSFVINGNGFGGNGAIRLTDQTTGTAGTGNDPITTINRTVNLASDSRIQVDNGNAVGSLSQLILSAAVTGSGGLEKTGNGSLTLSGAGNTYSGQTVVSNGVLRISGGNDRIPVASNLILGSGTANTSGTFDLNGQNQTVAGLTTAGTGTANTVFNNAGGSATFTVALASGSQTYTGILGGGSGSLNFAKAGAGNFILSGANTYTGSTVVSAGTLTIANAASLPSNTGAVTVASGGVLDVSAVAGGYNFGVGRVLTAGRTTGAGNDIVGGINVAGAFNIGGTNTAATATISGNTTFNAATLQFDLNNIPASGNDLLAVVGNLTLTGQNNLTITKLNGNLTNGNYTLLTYTGTLIGDASNFMVTGAGGGRQLATIVNTMLTPGSVQLAVSGAPANLTWVGNSGSNIWNLEGNANFTGAVDNRFFNDDAVTFNDTGVGSATPVLVSGALSPSSFTVTGSQNFTFNDGGSGSIAGTGNIALNSTGTVTLAVPVTTVGTITLTAGTLTVATGGSVAGPVSMTGGTVNATVGGSFAGPLTMTAGTVNATADNAFAGNIAINGGTFIATNSTGNAINSSSISVSGAGTLQVGNGGIDGNINGPVALASGGTLAFNRSDAVNLSNVISGSGNITNNGTGEVTLTTAISSGNYNITGSGKLILSGNLTGSTALTKSGSGTLQLSGTNSFTSNITVNAGTLELGATGTAGASGNTIFLANNTTIRTFAPYTTTGTTHIFSLADNATVTFDVPSTGNMSLLGNHLIGPTATLNKIGSGQINVGSSGTATVQTMNIQEGILRVTSNRLSGVKDINISSGAQFLVSDNGALNLPVTGSYSFSGNGPNNTGALRLSATGGTVVTTIPSPVTLTGDSMIFVDPAVGATGAIVLSGNVSGPGGIIKTGIGALQLTGLNNTYGGPTIVRDGALQISGGDNRIPVTSSLTLGDDINNTSGAFDLNGNNQTVAGLATAGTGTANTVANTGSGTPTFTVALASGSQTFAGQLGGSSAGFSFAKSGAGNLTLSGTNTYSGTTNVSAGTLVIATAASLPSTTSPVNVASGAVLDVSGVAGGYSFATGRTLTLGRTTTPANDLVGSASIAGTLNIGGTNTAATATISGALTLNAATVNFDLSNSLASGNDLVNIGGNLTATGTTTIFVNQTGSSLAQGNYPLFTYGGSLTGTKDNFVLAGSVSSSGTRATYTIDTATLGSVFLNVAGAPANLTWVGNSGNNVWDLTTTGNFSGAADTKFYNSDSVTFGSTGVSDPTPVTINSALAPATVTVSGTQGYTFSGTGSIATTTLTKNDAGSLTINVPVTAAATTVNAGTISVGTGGSITGSVAVTGGTLNGNTSGAVNGPLTMTGGIANGTVDGAINGSVAINGGTFVASNPTGSAINGGPISVSNSGVLKIGNGGTDGNISGDITLASGGTLAFDRSDAVAFGNGLTISGNSTIKNQGTGLVTRDVTTAVGTNTLTLGGNGNTTFGATVSGTGQIIKNDAGTVTLLANNNAFTGTVTVNAGTLVLDDLGASGDLSASLITINNSGKFLFGPNGNPDLPANTFITINTGGTSEFGIVEDFGGINLAGGGLLLSGGNANLTSASVDSSFTSGTITSTGAIRAVGGARAIVKTTPGLVVVTDTDLNATGGISILDGTISTNGNFSNTGALTLGDTLTKGTLQLRTNTTQTIGKPVALNAGGGTIDVLNSTGAVTWSGIISGSGDIEKAGAGTLILSGANTHTGLTKVSAGKLLINGNSSAATGNVNVSAGASLGGTGTVGGFANFANTAILAPGVSAGNLTLANGADLSSGGVYQWQLGALSTATNFDSITVSAGNLTLGGTSALALDFSLIAATDPNSSDAFWNTPQTWKIIDVTGTATNVGNANLATITNSSYSRGTFSTAVGTAADAGDIFLVFTPVVAGASTWQGANNDNWTVATSWSGIVPNSATAEAKFVSTGGTTANLNADQTVNKLTFDSTVDHTVSGAGKLTLTGASPSISTTTANIGTQTVSTNLDLAAGTAVTVNGGTLNLSPSANSTLATGVTATVALGATLNLGGSGNALSNGTTTHANVTNNGILAATSANKRVGHITGTGTTTVTATGASLTASSIRQGTLSIGAGNTVTVAPNGGNSGVSVLNSLSVTGGATPTGTLDLKDNDLIVKNTDLAAATATHALINAQVKNASNGFAWDQAGITSSTVQADLGAGTPTALGILLNNDGQGGSLFYGDGIVLPQFSGQTVNENAVLVKYTWLGDSDLNGVVNIDDFTYFQLGYGGGAPYTGWAFGDYDYNGVVNVDDFTYFQLGFGGQSGPALSAAPNALTGLGVSAVPEPGTWAVMIGLVGATALRARRWSKKKETLL